MDSFVGENLRNNPWKDQPEHPSDKFLELRSRSRYGGLLTRDEILMKHHEDSLLQQVDAITKAGKLRKKLAETKQKCIELSVRNRASDVLRSEELKRKLENAETILHSFEVCVTETEKLQQTLMQPFQGQFMKMENKYHKDVVELFTNCIKLLDHLQNGLDTLDWHKENSIDGIHLRKVIENLSVSVAELEKGLQIAEKSNKFVPKEFPRHEDYPYA